MVLTWNGIADADMSFATRVELSGLIRKRLASVQFGMSATFYMLSRIGMEIDHDGSHNPTKLI